MSIADDLARIERAKRGRDVRKSIHDAIKSINDVTQEAMDTAFVYIDIDPTDVNSTAAKIVAPGSYRLDSSASWTDVPDGTKSYDLLVYQCDSNYVIQVVFEAGYAAAIEKSNIYWRQVKISTTTPSPSGETWKKLVNDDDLTGGDILTWHGHLSSTDDIDTSDFWKSGMWVCSAPSDKPAHWPDNVGIGKLLVFGAAGSTSTPMKVQVIVTYTQDDIWWRIGRSAAALEAEADGWGPWKKLSSGDEFELDDVVSYRGYLTDSDDLDELLQAGFWTVSSRGYPANYPGTGYGKVISFGASDARTIAMKVQFVVKMNLEEVWFRTGRTNAVWNAWKQLGGGTGGGGGSGQTSVYCAIGASTTIGSDGDGGRAERPYPWWIYAMGGFTSYNNYAIGGTGTIDRQTQGSNNKRNHMDVVTDDTYAPMLQAADLITFNIGVNDRFICGQNSWAINGKSKTAGHSVNDFSDIYDQLIGSVNDFLPYYMPDAATPIDNRSISADDLYGNAGTNHWTVCGAWNFMLWYCATYYPNAQLILVRGLKTRSRIPGVTISNNTVTITPHDTAYWKTQALAYENDPEHAGDPYHSNHARSEYARNLFADKIWSKIQTIAENANVPIVDPNPAFWSAFTKDTDKYNDGPHPKVTTYDQYGRAIAATVLAKFRN